MAFHFAPGSGERIRTMSFANSSLLDFVRAPLKAAEFHLCTMTYTNSALRDMFGTALVVAAAFHLGTMPLTNSSDLGNFVHPSWLQSFFFPPCIKHSPLFWT